MILSVNDDGSITKQRLQDVLSNKDVLKSNNALQSKSIKKEHIVFEPKPKFIQFDKEFQLFDKFENKRETREPFECFEIEIPSVFKQEEQNIKPYSSKERDVNRIAIPKVFKGDTLQSESLQLSYWRSKRNKLRLTQKKWPPVDPQSSDQNNKKTSDPMQYYY